MLLAELQVWHSRPVTPTRRVALGHLVLPVDPAPGVGGVLLAAVVAAYLPNVPDDQWPDIARLIDQIADGQRIVQPRLQHRYQVDRHGLAVSVHQMVSEGDSISFDLHSMGRPLSQVLGAVYALERLDMAARRVIAPLLHRALAWRGPLGPSFIADITGLRRPELGGVRDPRSWALDILGFPSGTSTVTKNEVMKSYRKRLRAVHPDHGGDRTTASDLIEQLGEARRILLGA